ncbi:hypothetical protein ABW20_dc0104921 [Dactylellina cionopaga]|nr:hypothetical protein ABW20_dc0104921 [Dactylellina cionopaga]
MPEYLETLAVGFGDSGDWSINLEVEAKSASEWDTFNEEDTVLSRSEVRDRDLTPVEWKHAWYLRRIDQFMLWGSNSDSVGLIEENLTAPQHLALFLGFTVWDNSINSIDPLDSEDRREFMRNVLLRFYFNSIAKDFPPAQGIAIRLYNHFNMEYPKSVSSEQELCWLLNAAITGSFSAAADIKVIDEEIFEVARNYFRYLGGYNQIHIGWMVPLEELFAKQKEILKYIRNPRSTSSD